MTVTEVIDYLKQKADTKHHAGMQRFGIANEKALGVKIPEVRQLAKLIKKDHQLAQLLGYRYPRSTDISFHDR